MKVEQEVQSLYIQSCSKSLFVFTPDLPGAQLFPWQYTMHVCH